MATSFSSLAKKQLNSASDLRQSADFNFLMQSMERDKENMNATNYIEHHKSPPIDVLTKKLSAYLAVTSQIINFDQPKPSSLVLQAKHIYQDLEAILQETHPPRSSLPSFFSNMSLRKSLGGRLVPPAIQSKLEDLTEPVSNGSVINKSINISPMNMQNNPASSSLLLMTNNSSISVLVKRVKQLEVENERLNDLIAKHENTNIKMFIKINEEESTQIQSYKTQLEASFTSYKLLEAKVRQYKDRLKFMQKDNLALQKQSTRKSKLIQYLEDQLKKVEQHNLQQCSSLRDQTLKNNSLQSVIYQQNVELQKVYQNTKQIIQTHKEAQENHQREVESLLHKIKCLQDKLNGRKGTKNTQEIGQKDSKVEKEYYEMLLIQAGTIEQYLRGTDEAKCHHRKKLSQ